MEIKLFKAEVKKMRYESFKKAFEDFSKMSLFNKVEEYKIILLENAKRSI